MRNIAIVEDEDGAAEILSEYIRRFSKETGQEFRIDRFRDAVDFLNGYKAKYAVVFMDIQMPHRDGMSASVELRTLDKTVSLDRKSVV